MAFIETIAPGAAEGDVEAMYRRQQAAWGFIPNYAKAFSVRPEVLARWGQLLAEIKRPMDPRRFELVTFVAAVELRNTACVLVHGKKLRAWFSDEQIFAIASGERDAGLTETEQAMLAFARLTARDATQTTAAQVAALERYGFSAAEVFDIAAAAAGRAFFVKLLDGLGVLPDSVLHELDEPFKQALVTGRAIDDEPAVTVPLPEPIDR
jgi:alkylhydroperoxidase family enzyme